jgi:hypothetical protein
MKVVMEASYRAVIELLPGKTWDNLKKHASASLTFDDGTTLNIKEEYPEREREPLFYHFYSADDDGDSDFDDQLGGANFC